MEPIQLISFALILTGVYLVGREMGRRSAQRDILRSLNRMFVAFHSEQIQHAPDCPVYDPATGRLRDGAPDPFGTAEAQTYRDYEDAAHYANGGVRLATYTPEEIDRINAIRATVRRTRENDERVYGGGE